MENIKIENLRCFKNTEKITLNPLTVAVGKNSSGKSTILRTFPLFKQTMETKLSEPILWFGRYVDFGEFNESKSKFASVGETINFEFDFITEASLPSVNKFSDYLITSDTKNSSANIKITVKLYIDESIIKRVDIGVLENTIELYYDDTFANIKINGTSFKKRRTDLLCIDKIIPCVEAEGMLGFLPLWMRKRESIHKLRKESNLIDLILTIVDNVKIQTNKYFYAAVIYSVLTEDLSTFDSKRQKIKNFLSNPKKDSYLLLASENIDDKKSLKLSNVIINEILDSLDKYSHELTKYILETNISQIIELCNSYLSNYFRNIKYIAPVRATAQRYYRKQGLDIQEVDARGENVSAILQGMRHDERRRFDLWLERNFGFKIYTQSTEGHISLYVENDNIKTNIADTGFGYSQILPIILMLWKTSYGVLSEETQIVIEQPELHLHPKMQIQLIDLIIKIVSKSKKTKFLIETHSETIINYIGAQIESEKINHNDVSVLLIEQNEKNESFVRSVRYTPNGYLENWPVDFF